MHAKLSILLQSHNIVYQYFTTCNKFSHISLLFVSKKLFHNNTKITYFECWRTGHGGHRPTMVCDRVINPLLASPFTPLHRSTFGRLPEQEGEGKAARATRGRGFCYLLLTATKRARPHVEEAVPKIYHDRYVYMVISWMPDVDLSQLTMVEILLSAFKPFVTAVTK